MARMTVAAWLACAAPVGAHAGTFTTLYDFRGGADGSDPSGGLLFFDGLLYGTTVYGGTANGGTVFSFDPVTRTETVLYRFTGKPKGSNPTGSMLAQGNVMYGTTYKGGIDHAGILFQFDPATGTETVLSRFRERISGLYANGGPVYRADSLYGTTSEGGRNSNGTLFRLRLRDDKLFVLHDFMSAPDGVSPYDGLLNAHDTFYGTTLGGGAKSLGTVFQFNPATKTETILYSFGGPDGSYPGTGLTLHNGLLFGMTLSGGSNGYGTVFEIDPATGTESVLYDFKGKPDSQGSAGNLLFHDGKLYGASAGGGKGGFGTLFSVSTKTGAEQILHDFTGQDGQDPNGPLLFQAGTFYGTTSIGGKKGCRFGCGTLFSYTP